MPDHDKSLRQHLIELLQGGHAHATFDAITANIPAKIRGKKPANFPHSLWTLLEHLRIAQHDIVEFSRNPKHVSPPWPEGYWPKSPAPPSAAAWNNSVRQIHSDLEAMQKLVTSKRSDLMRPIPHGDGQTLLREALLLADHNAYHVGQL